MTASRAASWALVTTFRGPAAMVLPVVAHHLELGACEVHLYLDAPVPDLPAALAAEPRVRITLCDEAHWQALRRGGRPDNVVARQLANAEQARTRSQADWLLHLDADEFLHADAPPGEILGALPAGEGWAKIPNVERVLPPGTVADSLFAGAFRLPLRPQQARAIWGEDARFLRFGLAAYTTGKVAIRPRAPWRLRLHWARDPAAPEEAAPPPHRVIEGMRVLHLDGWTPLHWTAKLLRFVDLGLEGGHAGRREQIAHVAAGGGPAGLALFDRLHRLTPPRARALRRAGGLRAFPFDPRPAVARLWPEALAAFGPAAFDAALRASDPAFFARHRLG